MKKFYIPAILIFLLASCNNLDDAKLADRSSFMHFYEGAYSMTAAAAEITSDGYVIAGTVNVTGSKKTSRIIVIKTDKLGQRIGDEAIIEAATASSIKVLNDGFLVIGNSVEYNPATSEISELENYKSRLIFLDNNLNVVRDITSLPRETSDGRHVDFYGDAITINNEGASDPTKDYIITLGTYQEPGKSEFSYVSSMNKDLDTLWTRDYNYIVRDYMNAKSIYYNAGKVLWGTSVTETVNTFNYSYLAVPVVLSNSTFINSNYFGQNDNQQALKILDLCESPLGYAAVGTYSKPDGANSDIFFIRVDKNGNFDQSSVRYFDGLNSASESVLTAPSLSDVAESGESLTTTQDGGYAIAGTLVTDEGKGIGNGGQDLWLIKVDGFGITQWSRLIGGPTNESVASIRETADGGLLICGTIQDGSVESGGLSSIFLIKTDAKGELKK